MALSRYYLLVKFWIWQDFPLKHGLNMCFPDWARIAKIKDLANHGFMALIQRSYTEKKSILLTGVSVSGVGWLTFSEIITLICCVEGVTWHRTWRQYGCGCGVTETGWTLDTGGGGQEDRMSSPGRDRIYMHQENECFVKYHNRNPLNSV